jgi:hypothetical protein
MSARIIAIVLVILSLAARVLMAGDPLVVVGAGYQPPWDTDMELANGEGNELQVLVSQWPYSVSPCLSCPYSVVSIPARGTAKVTAREALTGNGAGGPAIRTLYVLSETVRPTVTARVVNRDRPSQTIELPVVRRPTIEALNPTVLAFPSAKRSADSHTNLILSEVSWEEGRALAVLLEAYSPAGERLGSSAAFDLSTGSTLFLLDVLAQLGVGDLANGQIRVTKTGGMGLMWGLLATVSDDGRVSVSPGMNP